MCYLWGFFLPIFIKKLDNFSLVHQFFLLCLFFCKFYLLDKSEMNSKFMDWCDSDELWNKITSDLKCIWIWNICFAIFLGMCMWAVVIKWSHAYSHAFIQKGMSTKNVNRLLKLSYKMLYLLLHTLFYLPWHLFIRWACDISLDERKKRAENTLLINKMRTFITCVKHQFCMFSWVTVFNWKSGWLLTL